MKKRIVLTCFFIFFIGIFIFCLDYYNKYYTGEQYFTLISNDGEKFIIELESGEKIQEYNYTQGAFNSQGKSKEIEFTGFKGRPLKKGAYLKLICNDARGVISWEEVEKEDIPEEALKKIEE